MLNRAVAPVKEDKPKALAMFNSALEDSRIVTSTYCVPMPRMGPLPPLQAATAKTSRTTVMQTAKQGKVDEVTYWWPRPGTIKPLRKHTFYTKVGDQICGVELDSVAVATEAPPATIQPSSLQRSSQQNQSGVRLIGPTDFSLTARQY